MDKQVKYLWVQIFGQHYLRRWENEDPLNTIRLDGELWKKVEVV